MSSKTTTRMLGNFCVIQRTNHTFIFPRIMLASINSSKSCGVVYMFFWSARHLHRVFLALKKKHALWEIHKFVFVSPKGNVTLKWEQKVKNGFRNTIFLFFFCQGLNGAMETLLVFQFSLSPLKKPTGTGQYPCHTVIHWCLYPGF